MDLTNNNITKFTIHYHKTKPIHIDDFVLPAPEEQPQDVSSSLVERSSQSQPLKIKYEPFHIQQLQQYNPLYSLFFKLNETNYNNISFNHKYHIKNLQEVVDAETQQLRKTPVFVKFAPLLDPLRYMIGKYSLDDIRIRSLPTINSTEQDCFDKLLHYTNASYTDSFFCFLTSVLLNQYNMIHGVDYYGSFLGIQEYFKMNVEDDLEYLANSSFFTDNVGKLFFLENVENRHEVSHFSRKNREKLFIGGEDEPNIEIDTILVDDENEPIQSSDSSKETKRENDIETVYETNQEEHIPKNHSYSQSSDDSSVNSYINYSSDEEEGHHDDDDRSENDDEDEDDNTTETECMNEEDEPHAYIQNFPIQMICLEKCKETLDSLFDGDAIDEKEGIAVLFQIVMILLVYQKVFHFTHNDLHTNNIMYVDTDQEFIHYVYHNNYYRVPTYGKIFKIIDFGRSIYTFQGKQFCSDSFAPSGDASTQYNFEPFFDDKKPLLEPNYSFDLCRLACSIYDFIIDDGEPYQEMNKLQQLVYHWCTDDIGKNVLYKRNGEERYPNFKLYKMIARTVHSHTPTAQLKNPIFKRFEFKNKKKKLNDKLVVNIDILPSLV
jgi:hypothetical protein